MDAGHECQTNSKCQPDWGLVGCIELYKLKSVDERIAYCKESGCCYVCGGADLVGQEMTEKKHKRCNYKEPVDRLLTKCTAWKNFNAQGRKIFCHYAAALCPNHQNVPNTNSNLLEWLKEKRIRHELFTIPQAL